ncbi:hypothetical protein HG530_002935 [Fusarium avenaceum]|nr:hypothetical protein HG530_002935 [Fusarium avenaceum]
MRRTIVEEVVVCRGGYVPAPRVIVAVRPRVPLVCVLDPRGVHVLGARALSVPLLHVDVEIVRLLPARVAHGAASPLPRAVSALLLPQAASSSLLRPAASLPPPGALFLQLHVAVSLPPLAIDVLLAPCVCVGLHALLAPFGFGPSQLHAPDASSLLPLLSSGLLPLRAFLLHRLQPAYAPLLSCALPPSSATRPFS